MQTVHANGANIPKLGFGTFQLHDATAREAVAAALTAGYRHIDTAQMYENEREVGAGLRESGVGRGDIFLTTKVWVDRFRDGDLQRSAADSLVRVGTDYIDLLLLHWPSSEVPLAETIGALNAARDDGLARHIGVSNFTVALVREAVAASAAPLATNQVEYHPRLSQAPVLAELERHGMALTAYCPLGQGKVVNEPAIVEIAQRHDRDPGQIMLRWHYQQPGVAAIPRSSRPERIASNFDIFGFELSADEMDRISGLASEDGRLISPESVAPAWDNAG